MDIYKIESQPKKKVVNYFQLKKYIKLKQIMLPN